MAGDRAYRSGLDHSEAIQYVYAGIPEESRYPRPDLIIDLFVISSDWARYNDRERFEILGIAAARILEPMQARGVTPDEIATHRLSPLWEQILEQAIVVS